MNQEMMHDFKYDVFLSYSSKDKNEVRKLAERLKTDRVNVWFDEWCIKPGDSIPSRIEQGLEDSRTLILVMSKNASASDWVASERQAIQFNDPINKSRRLIPIRLDDFPIKKALQQFLYIDWRKKNDEQYKKLLSICKPTFPPYDSQTINVRAAISTAVRLIKDDSFGMDAAEHQRGGWSKSYSLKYISRAFPKRKPEIISLKDSITVTHWIVRGLNALRDLELINSCLTDQDSNLLTNLLNNTRSYLDYHCRDGKGGLFTERSQGEIDFKPDVRHSATLAKALLEYSGTDDARLVSLLKFVLECALNPKKDDYRVPTLSEILAAMSILISLPELRDPSIELSTINKVIHIHEEKLLSMFKPVAGKTPASESEINHAGFFFDPVAGSHMAPYYTWWALDCYGLCLQTSKRNLLNSTYKSSLAGLLSLEIPIASNESGFPLFTNGLPDIGATAQIIDILSRQSFHNHQDLIKRGIRYITRVLCSDEVKVDFPFMLWAFFDTLRNCSDSDLITF
ncbi:MAG: toll/interleukin-1 receptor domain-containing protein [candidate division Zixibacteria bacterium]|nr:toll/interleukin-1 receptor domain-containing protein [candidate division Zixibacteria bacterium]